MVGVRRLVVLACRRPAVGAVPGLGPATLAQAPPLEVRDPVDVKGVPLGGAPLPARELMYGNMITAGNIDS